MPPPVTVMVPLLEDVLVLAVVLMVRVPLFEPLAGVTVSQEFALLLAVHEVFELSVMLVLVEAAAGEPQEEAERIRDVDPFTKTTEYSPPSP